MLELGTELLSLSSTTSLTGVHNCVCQRGGMAAITLSLSTIQHTITQGNNYTYRIAGIFRGHKLSRIKPVPRNFMPTNSYILFTCQKAEVRPRK